MFESKLFRFAESVDIELIKRVKDVENIGISLNREELEQAKHQRFELFDLLTLKLSGLQGISRNMMEAASSDESHVDSNDGLSFWFLLSNELQDINEIQNVIFALDRAIFDTLEVSHE